MRTSYKEGELLTKEDIGLVFKSLCGIEFMIEKINEREDYKILARDVHNNPYAFTENGTRYEVGGAPNILNFSSFVGKCFTQDKPPLTTTLIFKAWTNDCFTSRLFDNKESHIEKPRRWLVKMQEIFDER